MRAILRIGWVVVLSAVVACGGSDGDDDDDDDDGPFTLLEGIYSIDTYTNNSSDCDTEGEPYGTETHVFVEEVDLFGPAIQVVTCDTIETCRSQAAEDSIIVSGNTIGLFNEGSDTAGWVDGTFIGSNNAGSCEGEYWETEMTDEGGDSIAVTDRWFTIDPFPADADECTDDDAMAEAADSGVCGRLRVLTATYVEALP